MNTVKKPIVIPLPLVGYMPNIDGPGCPHWWVLGEILCQVRRERGRESAYAKAMYEATEAWWAVHRKPRPNL